MITIEEYIGVHANSPDWTDKRQNNAVELLSRVAALEAEMIADGIQFTVNLLTGSGVSGETMGGFRPQSCPIGAPHSAHKEGMAVDRYDPHNEQDSWIDKNPDALVRYNLYREHPDSTPHWCHLSTRAPASGYRTFRP